MNQLTELTFSYLQRYGCPITEDYKQLLQTATNTHQPPHGMAWYGNRYREQARNADWFANSLVLNSYEEGNGSRQVWELSQRTGNQDFAQLIRNHSIDESRHSKMFATLVDILFPTSLEVETRKQIKAFSPGYSASNHPAHQTNSLVDTLDEKIMMDQLIMINLLEIRALILQLLLRPVLQAYAQLAELEKVTRMSDQFIYDETQHIAYSAHCIGEYYQYGDRDWLKEQMINRQATVNNLFLEETESPDDLGKVVLTTGF
jgi:hypothetical protein